VPRSNATFGDHYIPHNGDGESLWLESGTKAVMQGLGRSRSGPAV
jgi:hypothetical protein